jgi:hypothetical protein
LSSVALAKEGGGPNATAAGWTKVMRAGEQTLAPGGEPSARGGASVGSPASMLESATEMAATIHKPLLKSANPCLLLAPGVAIE